jgi:hypothetical protein
MPAIRKRQNYYAALRKQLEKQIAALEEQAAMADSSHQALEGRMKVRSGRLMLYCR